MTFRTLTATLLLSLSIGIAGCEKPAEAPKPADGADHADHPAPTTLSEAVNQLEKMRDEVKKAFEAGTPEVAHDALHDVGDVLTATQTMAGALAGDAKEAAKSATDALMDAFAKLDGGLHDGAEVAYDEVGEDIEAAIAKLKGLLPAAAPAE